NQNVVFVLLLLHQGKLWHHNGQTWLTDELHWELQNYQEPKHSLLDYLQDQDLYHDVLNNQMLRPYSCQLLVGGKHLEDKLSLIAKNSSPNASPVQLSVVSRGEAFGR
ncbi:MAG: hypothetical protein AN485_12030, partial [Anabaena sp. MDT14b]